MHCVAVALALALDNVGNSMAARIAIMAITTRSSIKVKPHGLRDLTQHRKATPHLGEGAAVFMYRKLLFFRLYIRPCTGNCSISTSAPLKSKVRRNMPNSVTPNPSHNFLTSAFSKSEAARVFT